MTKRHTLAALPIALSILLVYLCLAGQYESWILPLSVISAVPLALFGGDALGGFAWTMLFGIFLATSSSIFIAAR